MPDNAPSGQTATDTATTTPDAASAESTAPDTSQSAPAGGTGSEPQSSTPDTTASTDQPSTTTPPPGTSAAPAAGAPVQSSTPAAPDWQQRYSHLQSEMDRRLNHAKLEMDRNSRETAELRAFRQQQTELAAQKNLRPWHKQNPENQKFSGLLQRAKTIDAQLKALPTAYADGTPIPPEHQEQIRQSITASISPQEREQLAQYREETTQFQQSFFQDPRATLAPYVQEMMREELARVQQEAQAQHQVSQDFNAPGLKELVTEHAADIKQALEEGVPYKHAIHMTQMFGELQRLRKLMPEAQRAEAMAKEQQRLAQGRASVTRDPAPSKHVDVYALAKAQALKEGIPLGTAQFNHLLDRLEKANKTT